MKRYLGRLTLRVRTIALALVLFPSVALADEDRCKDVINLGYREYVSKDSTFYAFEETFRKACEEHQDKVEIGANAAYAGVPMGYKQKQERFQRACAQYKSKNVKYPGSSPGRGATETR